jgi:hypothetical protein
MRGMRASRAGRVLKWRTVVRSRKGDVFGPAEEENMKNRVDDG